MKDPTWISLSDLKRLYKRAKFQIYKVARGSAVLTAAFLLFQGAQFTSYASFKLGKGKLEQRLPFSTLVQNMDLMIPEKDASASLVLLSRSVLGRSIQQLGLQATISPDLITFLKKPYQVLCSELQIPLQGETYFKFKDISYSGEKKESFYLHVLSHNTYEILNLKKQPLCSGKLYQPLSFEGIDLTLEKFPSNVSLEKLYPLHIHPLENIVKAFKPLLTITPAKKDPNVLSLKFTHSDREMGALFLNTLMQAYQDVLKEENQLMADVQIAYLAKKHKELSGKFDQEMEEHASYLKKNLGEQGFISLSQEIEMLAPPKENYLSKLFDVEFELAHFDTSPITPARADSTPHLKVDKVLENVSSQLKEATLALDLIKQDLTPPTKQDTLAFLIANVEKTKALFESTQEEGYKTELAFAKAKLETYLKDLVSSLIVRKQTLEEIASDNFLSNFQSIDLPSAKNLYINYNHELDSLQKELMQLAYLSEHLNSENFNLSSIGNVLSDGVSNNMIQKASELELQLKDAITHSYKEHERLKDALKTQKKFLASHLEQVQELKKIQLSLTKEKMHSLQQVIVSLLKTEKKLLHEKLSDLNHQMHDLPTKWCFENKFKFNNDLTREIMQGLVQVTESKQLASQLYQADARPLDRAFPPPSPNYPFLLLSSLLIFFLTALITYLYYYMKALFQGFPISAETLQSLDEPVAGSLSSHSNAPLAEVKDTDHETLRSLASFLETVNVKKGTAVGLFLGANSDYSHNIAHILHYRGKKNLILECDFNRIPLNEDIPGLWHYLSFLLESLPIRTHTTFDYVPGGCTLFSPEIFNQEKFASLIEDLKTRYDFVFLINRSPLKSTEALDLLPLVDAAIVSFEREPLEDLKKYSNWIRQKQNRYVTFVENEVKPFA